LLRTTRNCFNGPKNYKLKSLQNFIQRSLHGEVPLRHLRVFATMQVLVDVNRASLVSFRRTTQLRMLDI
jgi:hypothetical protein